MLGLFPDSDSFPFEEAEELARLFRESNPQKDLSGFALGAVAGYVLGKRGIKERVDTGDNLPGRHFSFDQKDSERVEEHLESGIFKRVRADETGSRFYAYTGRKKTMTRKSVAAIIGTDDVQRLRQEPLEWKEVKPSTRARGDSPLSDEELKTMSRFQLVSVAKGLGVKRAHQGTVKDLMRCIKKKRDRNSLKDPVAFVDVGLDLEDMENDVFVEAGGGGEFAPTNDRQIKSFFSSAFEYVMRSYSNARNVDGSLQYFAFDDSLGKDAWIDVTPQRLAEEYYLVLKRSSYGSSHWDVVEHVKGDTTGYAEGLAKKSIRKKIVEIFGLDDTCFP